MLIMSLRAGAGVDGLQGACRTVVFGELDWSPGVLEQAVGRVHRDGQDSAVTVYYLLADSGSDPTVARTLGLKREQVEGIINPDGGGFARLQSDSDRIAKLAEDYLERHG